MFGPFLGPKEGFLSSWLIFLDSQPSETLLLFLQRNWEDRLLFCSKFHYDILTRSLLLPCRKMVNETLPSFLDFLIFATAAAHLVLLHRLKIWKLIFPNVSANFVEVASSLLACPRPIGEEKSKQSMQKLLEPYQRSTQVIDCLFPCLILLLHLPVFGCHQNWPS